MFVSVSLNIQVHFYSANLSFTIVVCVLQVFKPRDLENEPKTSRYTLRTF